MTLRSAAIAMLLLTTASECSAQTLNSKASTFLAGKVGTRIGGGECAHAATEALRAAGAEFTPADLGADNPSPGDYVWGTLLKTVSGVGGKMTDSASATKLQPGDIIQYRNTKFVYPTYWTTTSQHTSIVATVNTAGSPTFVYEQNFNNVRTLRKNSIDLTKLAAGYVRVYRPKLRVSRIGQTKFTLTNNMTSSQSVSIRVGASTLGSSTLTAANTLTSYQIRWVTITGSATPITLRLANGQILTVTSAGGYEIYKTSAGAAALRKLTP